MRLTVAGGIGRPNRGGRISPVLRVDGPGMNASGNDLINPGARRAQLPITAVGQ